MSLLGKTEYETRLNLDVKPRWLRRTCTLVLAIFFAFSGACDRAADVESARDRPPSSITEDSEEDRPSEASNVVADESIAEEPIAQKPSVAKTREATIDEAESLAENGDLDAAISKMKLLLLVDPGDVEVIFRLSNMTAAAGDLQGAVELLDSIPRDHLEAGIPALGQAADWSIELQQFDEAEKRYKAILEVIPDAAAVHRKLAFLFNRQGRRYEAATHVHQLCRMGNVLQDELHSIIQLGDAMYDPPTRQPSEPRERLYYPIGESGDARKLFTDEKFQQAVDRLYDSVKSGDQPASIVAFFGRAAAEAQNDAVFQWWLGQADQDARSYAEYWAALGTVLWTRREPELAVRALLEALDRDPNDFRSIARLRAALKAIGRDEAAERWSQRWKALRNVSGQNNLIAGSPVPNTRSMEKLADLLDSLDRRLEAVLWRYLAGYYQGASPEDQKKLQEQLQRLVKQGRGFPDRSQRLCGMKIDEFALPPKEWMPEARPVDSADSFAVDRKPHPARFEDASTVLGLDHTYAVASAPQDRGFSVYQSVGGAVAAIDYDLDGKCDLYFTQGGADPPEFMGSMSNVLYRQFDRRVEDMTKNAKLQQSRYSTGVTVGDWNQDGFPDVVVANIGRNSLCINRGDGTFAAVDFDDRDDKTLLTTSLAMGDLNGDSVPDLFELNYLHDEQLSRRPERNEQGLVVGSLMPADFKSGMDRVLINDGRGQATFEWISETESDAKSGLGVILGDFDSSPGNEVFVGNDTDPNQLWIRNSTSRRWEDIAMTRGCAYAFDGVPTASMGVAAGDFDRNGQLDFHVTNFQDEYASLFLREGELFQDRSVRFGLAAPSDTVLGFGTQAIDYDNNGKLDLVVTNGHIEQAVTIRAPFEQPMQLFSNLGNRFELIDVEDGTGYWEVPHVGRGLTRLDFDRDGKSDFVVTHLGERSAMLINRTETTHHWLQLQLVGTASERDAVGAKVIVQCGGRSQSEWVLAGDGFFSSNEPILTFGLEDQSVVDRVSIRWPSGRKQEFRNLAADRRLLAIEGQEEVFLLP